MNTVELFSGIGSQREALKRSKLKQKAKIIHTSDWYIPSIISYDLLHNGKQNLKRFESYDKSKLIDLVKPFDLSRNGKQHITEKSYASMSKSLLVRLNAAIRRTNNLGNINNISASTFKKDIDLLTYSFPCQDLSNVGAFHGYINGIDKNKKTRSGLLWEVARILRSIKQHGKPLPKFLLLENVAALNLGRHRKNFGIWKKNLRKLGYFNKVYVLNALNFGIPQNRERLFMISIKTNGNKQIDNVISEYFKENDLEKHCKTSDNLYDFLRCDYNNDNYYREALQAQPNDTPSRKKIYQENHKLIDENNVVRSHSSTISTKQDRHPNAGVIYFPTDRNKYRFLTPRESFMLMGFREKQFEKLDKNNFVAHGNSYFFSRDMYYRLTGNSIVVNVLKNIFDQINDLDDYLETFGGEQINER